jgi:hypothetical protein
MLWEESTGAGDVAVEAVALEEGWTMLPAKMTNLTSSCSSRWAMMNGDAQQEEAPQRHGCLVDGREHHGLG